MKKNFFPMALMAIAMGLNACSSDDPVVNAGGGKAPFADGGYVKMAINMPSAPSSRAANDKFDGGLKNEYEVKNATLILFTGKKGEAEDAAIFHSIYELPVGMVDGSNSQITSTTRIVSKVNNDVPSSQLYAYVVLNDNGLLDVAKSEINVPSGTSATTSLVGMTFSAFKNTVVVGGADKFKSNGFLMDNAPLSSEKGGNLTSATPSTTSEPQTLVNLTDKVCKSQAEADAKPATDVYVERALAKVTMTKVADDGTNNKLTDSGVSSITGDGASSSSKVAYSIEGWVLDVTNKKSYLGRSYDKSWNAYAAASTNNYRFLGSDALGSLYRTYWGVDPNYYGYVEAEATENFTYLNAKPKDTTKPNITPLTPTTYNEGFGENNPLYCMENTFDVANMQERQVTRAIVKVKFFNGNPFYTFNDDKSMLYDKVNMEKRVKQAILKNPAVLTKLATDFNGTTIGEGNIELAFEPRDKDGKVLLKSYTVHKVAGTVDDTTDKTYSASTGSTLNQDLHLGSIVEYKDGYAYYPIRIKHFGDELTPWNSKTATVDHPYGDPVSPNDFLGRYGVLRNNWYHIEITSIKNVGSAVVPEIKLGDTTSGDKPENYISVRINVLSWAKRTQSEIL